MFNIPRINVGILEFQNVITTIDTASKYIYIPLGIMGQILRTIEKTCKCGDDFETYKGIYCNCSSRYDYIFFPTFYFKISGGLTLSLYPIQYSYFPFTETLDNQGYFLLREWENDYWSLGLPFTQEFYLVFDYDNAQLGFYALKQSKTFIISGILAASVAGVFLLVFVIGILNKRFC